MSNSPSNNSQGSDTPARTNSESKTVEAPMKGGTKASRQRFKPQLSCTLCRTRKLKCDRNSPCQNCVKRDLSSSCTYVHAGLRGAKSSSNHKSNNLSQKDVQSQISHLEELVVSLMNKSRDIGATTRPNISQQQSSNSTSSPDFELRTNDEQWTEVTTVNDATESLGMINIKDNQSNYVDSSHWTAILDNIACLKDSLDPKEEQVEKHDFPPKPRGPDLLVGSIRSATRTEILASLPSKGRVDRLVSAYFSVLDMGAILLHRPTFEREYASFWANPANTSITWIGLLYSIICQATQFESMQGKSQVDSSQDAIQNLDELVDVFREKTVQCLVLGNYTEPGPYTIETLCFYFISEHFRSADAMFGLWMVWGIIIRAAFRLGLHRDASNYPKISAYQGEMNRRVWSCLVHLDIMTSCQVGLPRMIKDGTYDTGKASNLDDSDFDQNTKVLPPARPDSDLTPSGFHNVKNLFAGIFGQIVDQSSSTKTVSYEELMSMDKALHEAHRRTPEHLRVDGALDLQNGSVDDRMRKFTCALTFQKARCFLHRRFFVVSKETSTFTYPYSMKSCVDAAAEMIQVQIYWHAQQKPGMPLFISRWKTSSLMTQDYLMSAMLLCLYLGHCVSIPSLEENTAKMGTRVKMSRKEMLQMLDNALEIWEDASSNSREAAKAAEALKQMLKKVRAMNPTNPAEPSRIPNVQAVSGSAITPQTHVSRNKAYTWMNQVSAKPVSFDWASPPSFDNVSTESTPSSNSEAAPINNNLMANNLMNEVNLPMDLDWDIWNSQFQEQSGLNQWNFANPTIFPPDPNNPNYMQWDL